MCSPCSNPHLSSNGTGHTSIDRLLPTEQNMYVSLYIRVHSTMLSFAFSYQISTLKSKVHKLHSNVINSVQH